jgi:hypothetical protein
MDNRPLTPREMIEARREERESRRLFIKHHYQNPFRFWELVLEYVAWLKVKVAEKRLKHQNELLKSLVLIPKFCNGLIGVSLTDTLLALASN